MTQLFISHSSQDDAFVRDFRAELANHGQEGWIDSRELRGGDLLWLEIKKAIDEATAYAVVVSVPDPDRQRCRAPAEGAVIRRC